MARIGILEDNDRISKLYATMLGYVGHTVTIYADAHECLRALHIFDVSSDYALPQEASQDPLLLPIDALIIDLHLPVMNGIEVLRALRASLHAGILPLILCTAATDVEISQAFSIAPHAALVEKPFKLQKLITAISGVLPTSQEVIH